MLVAALKSRPEPSKLCSRVYPSNQPIRLVGITTPSLTDETKWRTGVAPSFLSSAAVGLGFLISERQGSLCASVPSSYSVTVRPATEAVLS